MQEVKVYGSAASHRPVTRAPITVLRSMALSPFCLTLRNLSIVLDERRDIGSPACTLGRVHTAIPLSIQLSMLFHPVT
jgi:hypothetical protein